MWIEAFSSFTFIIPAILFIFAAVNLFAAAAIYLPNRTSQARLLALTCFFAAGGVFANGMEHVAQSLQEKFFWVVVYYFANATLLPTLLGYLVMFLRIPMRVGLWIVGALSLVPFITVILIAAYPSSRLIYKNIWLDSSGLIPILQKQVGPFYAVNQIYYIILFLGFFLLITWIFRNESGLVRRQGLLVSLGLLIPLMATVILHIYGKLFGVINYVPFSFLPASILMWFGVNRYHLVRIRPFTSSQLLEHLEDGIFMVDQSNVLTVINPAGKKYIAPGVRDPLGKLLVEVSPIIKQYLDNEKIGRLGGVVRINGIPVQVSSNPMMMKDGEYAGDLIIIRDVSDRVRAQELKDEENRRVTAWRERQRIARTLHDSINQYLNSLVLLSTTAQMRLEQGRPEQLRPVIDHITRSARQASAELRQMINELQLESAADVPFNLVSALDDRIELISEANPIEIEFVPCMDLGLTSTQQREVFYILLEALNNILQHSQAKRVVITFTQPEGWFVARVEDDGVGFLPSQEKHHGMGLSNMLERARLLSGEMTIESAPDNGTSVWLKIPIELKVTSNGKGYA